VTTRTRMAKAGILSRRMLIAATAAMGLIAFALGYFIHPINGVPVLPAIAFSLLASLGALAYGTVKSVRS
jgi:4-hydroxybenzoate polyprenyltransferase